MKDLYKNDREFTLKINHKNRGFTLVEVILAFAIFAIIMGGTYGIVMTSMRNNKAGEVKQKAALYGQQIFEDIKSGEMKKNDDINYELSGINFKEISSNENKKEFQGDKEFGNGYSAKIALKKVNSISLDKDSSNLEENNYYLNKESENNNKVYEFKYNIETYENGSSVKIENSKGNNITITNVDEKLNIIIETETASNKKNVLIKSNNSSGELEDSKAINSGSKDNQIKIIFNFYNLKFENVDGKTQYKDVEIEVYNKDNIPLNIELQKSKELKVGLITKEGKVREFTNRSENEDFGLGELYDIEVKIQYNKGNTEFVGNAMYNIYIK
ncbi:prepilin-type N-terminal cleavage/methylation domain-containing protein [Clostridium sp. ZBS2]|uniref:type IV pilus modification PilV family protein n=1 Tax=Clostridium sp. ZBS2 TaxID=2949976 RepID=UPI00207A3DBC|nr:prepilin-type N-terminal cleavage/methylation domain-containing protein [Clostridium sp. ZBS2]